MSWREQAACLGTDHNAFFPPRGGPIPPTKQALELCNQCPVTSECLEYAIATDQRHGIWGGVNARARRTIREEQQRGVA